MDRFSLLSDTHIPARAETQHAAVNMTANLAHVVRRILASPERPQGAFVTGDLSYLHGLRQDYALFATTVYPLRAAGIPIAVILGNHDDRDNFRKSFNSVGSRLPGPPDRHVGIVESRFANWLLLDSLEVVDETPGQIGAAQLEWLDQALAAYATKPAIVLVHHNPDHSGGKALGGWFGMRDTDALYAVVSRHPHVKVLFHGHTHQWQVTRDNRAPFAVVNLPPTAYAFDPAAPIGWVDAVLDERGMRLTLQCLDTAHPQHGSVVPLPWGLAVSAVNP